MESVIAQLRKIGLTEYEAKTYLALLNTHLSTALKVSEKSGVLAHAIFTLAVYYLCQQEIYITSLLTSAYPCIRFDYVLVFYFQP